MNDFLAKPIERQTLWETASRYLTKVEALAEIPLEPAEPCETVPADHELAASPSASAPPGAGPMPSAFATDPKYARLLERFISRPPDRVSKLDVLKGHCERLGRPFEQIEITTLDTVNIAPGAQSAADVIAICRQRAALGVQHAIFNMPNVHEIAPLETFAREIIPAVAEL